MNLSGTFIFSVSSLRVVCCQTFEQDIVFPRAFLNTHFTVFCNRFPVSTSTPAPARNICLPCTVCRKKRHLLNAQFPQTIRFLTEIILALSSNQENLLHLLLFTLIYVKAECIVQTYIINFKLNINNINIKASQDSILSYFQLSTYPKPLQEYIPLLKSLHPRISGILGSLTGIINLRKIHSSGSQVKFN